SSRAVEAYDPVADRWDRRASLPTGRDHLAAVAASGRLYAIGGRVGGSYARNLAVVEAYDPGADRWERRADLPTPRSGIAAALWLGQIVVMGGEAPSGTFATVEAYDPVTDRWAPGPPMPTARHGLGAAVLGPGLYAVAGGPTPGGSRSGVVEVLLPR
ncbi:MAG TPA: galactose oxidase, partial [Candidatus Methylomirabilis sp.]|nr:galactose oxidase [Candidatus Methylomirabilis sp.]